MEAAGYLLQLVRYIHRNPLRAGLAETLSEYQWSSHAGYLSRTGKWNRLHKEYVLSMLSGSSGAAVKTYRNFMNLNDEAMLLDVYGKKILPSILGSEGFINRIKEQFFSGQIQDEIPRSRELAPAPELIKQTVCSFYHVHESALTVSRRGFFNEPRNVSIYLIRRLRRDGLQEIGRQFQMHKYSSVSSVIERIKNEISTKRDLGNRVDRIIRKLSKSQRKT